jgi:hypothetical protein
LGFKKLFKILDKTSCARNYLTHLNGLSMAAKGMDHSSVIPGHDRVSMTAKGMDHSSVIPGVTGYPSKPKAWTPDQVGGDGEGRG